MAYVIQSRTFSDVVTVEEAATHLRVWDVNDQPYIQSLIEAAIDTAEKYMNRLIAESTVTIQRPTLTQQLPLGTAKTISEVTYINAGTEERETLPGEMYSLNPITNKIEIKRNVQRYLSEHNARDFQISLVTGWSASEVPAAIKQGILMLVGTMYEMREDATVGQGVTVSKVPVTHQYLFNKHKLYPV